MSLPCADTGAGDATPKHYTTEQNGIPMIAETVRRNNEYATSGVDAEFGKGSSLYERYYGDASTQPNPCLGSIDKAPFYAMRIDAGDVGTKGGLLTDADARVLGRDGQPIVGLYCIGKQLGLRHGNQPSRCRR